MEYTHILYLEAFYAPNPDEVVEIQSRDPSRKIKAHVYRAGSASEPCPVLINFHGSGFVFPYHGSDDEFCLLMSQRAGYTVLDVQYRLAPEHPFPAALNDCEDAVNWILQQAVKFDRARVALSGFSAGGTLALAASSTLFPRETFHAVVSFYPPIDFYSPHRSKVAPGPTGRGLPAPMAQLFTMCYILASHDKKVPRISPFYAQPGRFPNRVSIITAAKDNLAPEAEKLAVEIEKQDSNRKVVRQRMDGCDHAFNILLNTAADQEARDKAYDIVARLLNEH
ncbi:putative esterase/lipase [Aspergillus undulatus]|uniref:putative esterase/lipase n=1 Tax=Aspergillus undulatus TaxID=1810928 RepID=UPI003CCE0652